MSRIDALGAVDYEPSLEDLLKVRLRTRGITEERYTIDDNEFVVVDVGGQRNERRKWIHCL